ncbi:TPA: hypothetical protein LR168_004043 [Escherichia coli]|nr:hypothetical protein [Escherichia coli]
MMFEQPWNIPVYDAESEKQSLDYRMKTQQVDWSEAPDWATCVVLNKTTNTFAWSDGSMYAPILRNPPQIMENADDFEIFEKRSCGPATPIKTKLLMTPKARGNTYEEFIATGWNDDQLVEHGYAVRTNDEITKYEQQSLADLHLAHLFTPVQQPSTASDLLKQAEQLLTERGKQYDTSGQERSSAKIVAAFNTITGRDLTPGEGWLFLMLLKAVRFYSNTETPHRDSLEDLISYAALHAEEYLNDER